MINILNEEELRNIALRQDVEKQLKLLDICDRMKTDLIIVKEKVLVSRKVVVVYNYDKKLRRYQMSNEIEIL